MKRFPVQEMVSISYCQQARLQTEFLCCHAAGRPVGCG